MLAHSMPPSFKQEYNKSLPLRFMIELISKGNIYNEFSFSLDVQRRLSNIRYIGPYVPDKTN